jgi:hypothetical protein
VKLEIKLTDERYRQGSVVGRVQSPEETHQGAGQMTDLTPNDLSHLSDEAFEALCTQGYHAPGPEPLSPAAQAVLDAINKELDEAPWDVSFLAGVSASAALLAAADQVVLMRPHGGRAWTVEQAVAYDALTKAFDLLNAIAAELEAQ